MNEKERRQHTFYFCLTSGRAIVIPRQYITVRSGMFIKAVEGYFVNTIMSPVAEGYIQLALSTVSEVEVQCDLISVVQENDTLYKAVLSKVSGIATV